MRLKFLLRPGWIGLILLVALFSTLCFMVLSPWQFGRNEQTQNRNTQIAESFQATAKPLEQVLPGDRAPGPSTEWQRVTFRGRYLPGGETLAWLRTVQGEPAMEVLTPFRLDSGQIVLVDRGYIRQVGGTQVPPYAAPPHGQVTLTARVRADETDSEHRPTFQRSGHRWSYSVDSRVVSKGTGIALHPGYFALTDEQQPGALNPLPLPRLESGPYFSYALQWIAFGVMAPLAVGYLIYSELRPASARPEQRRNGTEQPRPRPRRRRMSVAQAIAEDERREQEQALGR